MAMPSRVPHGQKGMRGVVLMPIKNRRGFFGHAKVGRSAFAEVSHGLGHLHRFSGLRCALAARGYAHAWVSFALIGP
jgi:hypothetical protein